MDGLSPNQFKGIDMNNTANIEDLLRLNIQLYDLDLLDGNIIGETARRGLQKTQNTVQLLRCIHKVYYARNIIAVFLSFRCPNCGFFFKKKTVDLKRHLTTCSEQ